MAFFTRALVFCHCCVPSRFSTGFTPFGRAILLHQVQPRQRNIQARALGILQDHEFGRAAVFLRNLFQSLVLADAVLDVHHVIADGEIAKVGEERRDFRLLPLRMGQRNFRLIEQIARAEENQVRLRQRDAFGHISLHDGGGGYVFREVGGLVHINFAARLGGAAANAERQVVLVEDVGQALDFAGAGNGKDDALAFAREASDLFRHGGDRAVKARRGLGLQREMFVVAVGLDSQLLHRDDRSVLQALLPLLRRQIQIFGRTRLPTRLRSCASVTFVHHASCASFRASGSSRMMVAPGSRSKKFSFARRPPARRAPILETPQLRSRAPSPRSLLRRPPAARRSAAH